MSEVISLQNINGMGTVHFEYFVHSFLLILFRLMCGCGNTVKYTREESEVYGGNIEVRAICEIYKSLSVLILCLKAK
jgi:hypothetical protein